jgi:hypothetical protein
MKGIRLHKLWGLNPTIPVCIVCGKEKGEVALLGAAYKERAPMHMIIDVEPCPDCREKFLKTGVMIVEAEEDRYGDPKAKIKPNGNMVIVKAEAFPHIFNGPVPEGHIAFAEPGVLVKLGLLKVIHAG